MTRTQRGGSIRRFQPDYIPSDMSKVYRHQGGTLMRFQPYRAIGGGLTEMLAPFTPGGAVKRIKKGAKRKLANSVVDAVTTALNKRAKKKVNDLFS